MHICSKRKVADCGTLNCLFNWKGGVGGYHIADVFVLFVDAQRFTFPCSCAVFSATLVTTFVFYRVTFSRQGNEVYGGSDVSAGIFLHRSSDDAIVKGERRPLWVVRISCSSIDGLSVVT